MEVAKLKLILLLTILLIVQNDVLNAQKQPKCWTPFPYEWNGKIKRVHAISVDFASEDFRTSGNWEAEWWFDEQGLMTNASFYADPYDTDSETINYLYVYNDNGQLLEQWESFGRNNKKYEIRYSYYYNEDYSQAEIIDEKVDSNCKIEYYNAEGKITGSTLCDELEKSPLNPTWLYKDGQNIRYVYNAEDDQGVIIEYEYDDQKRLIWEGIYTSKNEIAQNVEYVHHKKDNINVIEHNVKIKPSGRRKWKKRPYRYNYRFFRDALDNIIRSEVRTMDNREPYCTIIYNMEYYE